MSTELQEIKARIDARTKQIQADRERQAELIRERIAQGHTWTQVCLEAGVSRPTISLALRGRR